MNIITCYQNGVYFIDVEDIFDADIYECVKPNNQKGFWFQSISDKNKRKSSALGLKLYKYQKGDVLVSRINPIMEIEIKEVHYNKGLDAFFILILDSSKKYTAKELNDSYYEFKD